jgi:O-acetyl-ADP-ribose deacetylase
MRSHMEIEVRLGDITDQPDVDALVNPSNDYFMLTGHIGGAIRTKGGEEIEREAQAKGPVDLGEAVLTTGGALPNKCVVHAAIIGLRKEDLGVELENGSDTSGRILGAAILNALETAETHGVESIALPPMGCDDARYPLENCSRVMLSNIQAYATTHPRSAIKRVVIVTPSAEVYAHFRDRMLLRMAS